LAEGAAVRQLGASLLDMQPREFQLRFWAVALVAKWVTLSGSVCSEAVLGVESPGCPVLSEGAEECRVAVA